MDDQLEDIKHEKPTLNVWRLEKLRIWFNVIVCGLACAPYFLMILTDAGHRREHLDRFLMNVAPVFLKFFLIYNLIFSVIYLFEKSEINRNNQLMSKQKRTRVFLILTLVCLFHVVWLHYSGAVRRWGYSF